MYFQRVNKIANGNFIYSLKVHQTIFKPFFSAILSWWDHPTPNMSRGLLLSRRNPKNHLSWRLLLQTWIHHTSEYAFFASHELECPIFTVCPAGTASEKTNFIQLFFGGLTVLIVVRGYANDWTLSLLHGKSRFGIEIRRESKEKRRERWNWYHVIARKTLCLMRKKVY